MKKEIEVDEIKELENELRRSLWHCPVCDFPNDKLSCVCWNCGCEKEME